MEVCSSGPKKKKLKRYEDQKKKEGIKRGRVWRWVDCINVEIWEWGRGRKKRRAGGRGGEGVWWFERKEQKKANNCHTYDTWPSTRVNEPGHDEDEIHVVHQMMRCKILCLPRMQVRDESRLLGRLIEQKTRSQRHQDPFLANTTTLGKARGLAVLSPTSLS